MRNSAHHARIEVLGGLDSDVVEAAGLAHDLGHPPFGHIGEMVLDTFSRDLLKLNEGFEGNAQTFRIVTRLEPRTRRHNGLDLTAASRAAVLKYPWPRGPKPAVGNADRFATLKWEKFGAYLDDIDAFTSARSVVPVAEGAQSLEAAIMDIADDITYALHDLEDFHGSRLLEISAARDALEAWNVAYSRVEPQAPSPLVENPFELLRGKLARDYSTRYSTEEFEEAADNVDAHLALFQQGGTGTRRQAANTRKAISQLITDFVATVGLNYDEPDVENPPALMEVQRWHQIQILKEITRQFIIRRPDFAVIQRGQQELLTALLDLLKRWCEDSKDRARLPGTLREGYEAVGARAIVDYVAGLSDHQASALHRALTGHGPQSLLASFVP